MSSTQPAYTEFAEQPRIIAFCGPKYSGKDTAAKVLLDLRDRNGNAVFRRAPFAEGVKNICREMFGYTDYELEDPVGKETPTEYWPHLAPRYPMMDIANFLRDKYSSEVHVKRWERKTQEYELQRAMLKPGATAKAHVITDLRFPEEVEMLKRNGALTIYVQRDEAEQSLKTAKEAGDLMAANVSESHYQMLYEAAKVIVRNNFDILTLHLRVLEAVDFHFGRWQAW